MGVPVYFGARQEILPESGLKARENLIHLLSQQWSSVGAWRADISSGVIHDRAERPPTNRRSDVVNNSAAGENIAGGRPASARSRSLEGNRTTVNRRLPGEPEALATTSNRTTPQEGYNISSVDSRAKGRKKQKIKRA